jgi:hypothetical protein
MDNGQKTPHGHPDLNSYVKILRVLALITDRQTDGQTDGQTDRQRNTLAARGLEELFFQLCCCVSFLVSGGK